MKSALSLSQKAEPGKDTPCAAAAPTAVVLSGGQRLSSDRSDRLFWSFVLLSILIHGVLLAGSPRWFERKPLQVIELDLLPPVAGKVWEEPPKGEETRPLAPAPALAMPDVKPQPKEEPKRSEPVPQPKPLQRVELPQKPKKPRAAPAPPKEAPAPSAAETDPLPEEAGAPRPETFGIPQGKPASPTVNGTDDAVKLFLAQVRQRIDRFKHYPYAARRRQVEGRVTVRFVIHPDGTVAALQVVKSSASSLLDDAAVKAVQDAAPFPGFPRDVLAHPLAVEIGLVFELT
ncbi:TonB family protein [Desulfosoma sp.]